MDKNLKLVLIIGIPFLLLVTFPLWAGVFNSFILKLLFPDAFGDNYAEPISATDWGLFRYILIFLIPASVFVYWVYKGQKEIASNHVQALKDFAANFGLVFHESDKVLDYGFISGVREEHNITAGAKEIRTSHNSKKNAGYIKYSIPKTKFEMSMKDSVFYFDILNYSKIEGINNYSFKTNNSDFVKEKIIPIINDFSNKDTINEKNIFFRIFVLEIKDNYIELRLFNLFNNSDEIMKGYELCKKISLVLKKYSN